MANSEHVAILRRGVEQWNQWASEHPLLPADLEGADLEGADLMHANLVGANLEGANLEGARLSGANLEYAWLIGAGLTDADLAMADLEGANLVHADLSGAHLQRANLDGANLTLALLGSAEFRAATLVGADLDGADLVGADLFGANLEYARLIGARLEYAQLLEAKLMGAKLGGAKLGGALLVGADLTRADLKGADLDGAHLGSAQLKGVVWDSSTRWPEGFEPPESTSSRVDNAAHSGRAPVGAWGFELGPLVRREEVDDRESRELLGHVADLIASPTIVERIDELEKSAPELAKEADLTMRSLRNEVSQQSPDPLIVTRLYERLTAQLGLFDSDGAGLLAGHLNPDEPEPFLNLYGALRDSVAHLGDTDPLVAGKAAESVVEAFESFPPEAVLGGGTVEEFLENLGDREVAQIAHVMSENDPQRAAELEEPHTDTERAKAETKKIEAETQAVLGAERRANISFILKTSATTGTIAAAVLGAFGSPELKALIKIVVALFQQM